MTFTDIICAPLSAPGQAAVSLIRISGKGAIELAASRFDHPEKLLSSTSHSIIYGNYISKTGTALDEVLLYKFIAPHSYTGEDTIELSCHGNPFIVARILEDLLLDCRLATPGEFTRRAYLNGKLDLIQAEAVNDLITAEGEKAEASALQQLQGRLTAALTELLERIRQSRIRIELAIDFSDQDLPMDLSAFETQLSGSITAAEALAEKSRGGKFIREGIRICLAGAPNAGKSSLFNAFLEEDRALVSPQPGTTRDYLEEHVQLAGYKLIIFDTAGLRSSGDELEQMGITKTHKLLESADLILYLQDSSAGLSSSAPAGISADDPRLIPLLSKIDLGGFTSLPPAEEWHNYLQSHNLPDNLLPLSTVLEHGLQPLQNEILSRLQLPRELPQGALVTNSRQLAALKRSINSLKSALQAHQSDLGYEFIAFDLIEAASALQEILGTTAGEDMLGEIFANFCIGK